ncbi:MAG: cobalamin B12-binding domain-containing protein [Phreatobacter sp.]|nr:cobalamin B12-binding domain-containing protein [Phreatobacter sp.]
MASLDDRITGERPRSHDDSRDGLRVAARVWYPNADLLTADMRRDLAKTIETQVIPRLLMGHRTAGLDVYDAESPVQAPQSFSYADVEAFCELIVRHPLPAARQHIDALIAGGMSLEGVITAVLCSAARHLGLLWDGDRLSFVDVTVGLSRIQQLLRSYGPAFSADVVPKGPGYRILLALVPGGQHTLGLSVVEEFFRRAGWDVENEGAATRQQILDRVHDEWFDAVGLSASGETSRDEIAAVIALVRDASANPRIQVVVGGYHFVEQPQLAVELGADFGARDPTHAIETFARETLRARIEG